jgi:hypothetical protein
MIRSDISRDQTPIKNWEFALFCCNLRRKYY